MTRVGKTGVYWVLVLTISAPVGRAITPKQTEFHASEAYFDRVFLSPESWSDKPSLEILFEDVSDPITRGHSWRGGPFQLGDRTFSHGIQFNASKNLRVHLGNKGARFSAVVGLEDNDDTRRGSQLGQGSITFRILVRGETVFDSGVMRIDSPPAELEIPLEGARDFEIRVGDAGDGRGWDQAVLADARILLENGTELRLQDLPEIHKGPNPYGISFTLDGVPSTRLLPTWKRETRKTDSEEGVQTRIVTYTDPKTGLVVEIETKRFEDFPALEWVAHLKNGGDEDTPILESIQAIDTSLGIEGEILHWSNGGVASFDDFRPHEKKVEPGMRVELEPGAGRSSSQVLPFFNLEGQEKGVIVAIGWTGQWRAEFSADSERDVSLRAGMAHTHLRLYPGEEIRTPRILLLHYEGDRWRGQNLLRRFILEHHRPKENGQPLVSPITNGNWGGTSATVHLDNIEKIIENRLPIEYYWIDAEWYGSGPWVTNVGSWTPKADLYPNGFKPLSDKLRKSGRELMLWFEPERVYRGTDWYEEHKDWLLGYGEDNALWNLANPDARRFLTDFISDRITEYGLGCYRQDFNIEPLRFWKAADAPDRQGITEIRYIEGLYAFWDELLRRHPGLIIDNCASGGRRIDLETVGRATPFWRTDGPRDPIAHQCHTYGLLPWVPFSATSQDREGDDYDFRSGMSSSLCLNWWVSGDKPAEEIPDDFPYDWARKTLEDYLSYRQLYEGDFYPLTSYSQAKDQWMVYQLDRPETGKGMVVALKRPESRFVQARFPLRGLASSKSITVVDLDSGEKKVFSSRDLLEDGLEIRLEDRPDSAIFLYEWK